MNKHPYRLIMGRHCVEEVMKNSPARLLEVYTCQTEEDDLYSALVKNKVKICKKSKKQLYNLVQSESHQSYVAAVKEIKSPSVKEFLDLKESSIHSLVLLLDSIYDPQNLGAILRAAECFRTDLVLYSKNRGADITPTVSKTSAGATELVPLCKVSNLVETMQTFQKRGYLAFAADVGGHTKNLYQFEFPEKSLIVIGSEGVGIQPLLKKKCDFHVTIPMLGSIDSLNVSQATAILLNSYRYYFSMKF